MGRIASGIRKATNTVHRPPEAEGGQLRKRELPTAANVEEVEEVADAQFIHRKAQAYQTIEVASSKGKKYRITVPQSYAKNIPKVWEWTPGRMKAAELLAAGISVQRIPDDPEVGISSKHIIYAWLQHPEFKEHVDALILETGFASQRERIAGLTRLTQRIFDRLLDNADMIPVTEKSVGALITGVLAGMKQLGQEKGEFIEQQHIQQDTNLKGNITTASLDVSELLKSKTEEERKALEAEFDAMGNDLIRNLTGDKDAG